MQIVKDIENILHIHVKMAKQTQNFIQLIHNNIKGKVFVGTGKSRHLC